MKIISAVIRFFASLKMAVILITAYAAIIAGTSILESRYGTPAVHFAVYGSWWFLAINVLLAVNVLFAALVRIPWQRRHIGFVITHLGILTLMAGCLISWYGGSEASLPVVEGRSSGRAYQESQHLVLEITDKSDSSAQKSGAAVSSVQIPFVAGPFNWGDYQTKLFWFPWRLARRSQGVLYDHDGVRVEALDYMASEQEPRAELRVTADGVAKEFWLTVSEDERPGGYDMTVVQSAKRRVAIALRQDFVDLGFLVYLHKFQGKLDPGSGMASHYSSLVDFLARDSEKKILQKDVTITLNAPVDFTDPQTGRTWRLFQSSFRGPWKPGTPEFETWAGDDRSRDQLYLSVFTLSHDPGRPLKYTGGLLIVAGIAVVYYMRKNINP